MAKQTSLWRRSARLGVRAVDQHRRWVIRGLSGGQTRLVASYLIFLALLGGIAIGLVLTEEEHPPVAASVPRTPPPVTPPPPDTRWVEVKTTGYCPCAICCGKDADGRTAINRPVARFPYGIAVAPKLIPYREWLYVPGYGEFMVDDTGGAMRQSAKRGVVHLDLRFKTHQQARKWGVRWLWIAVPDHARAARYGLPRDEPDSLATGVR